MKDIEKNDVDISSLFHWGDHITIHSPTGSLTVYVKILGDADINRARVFALRKSAEMRAKLLDLDSDERVALIPPLDTSNRDKVTEILLTLLAKEIADRATKEMKIVYPVEPDSEATLKEQEKYQAKVDNFPVYIQEQTRKAVDIEAKKERKKLNKLSMEELDELYVTTLMENICETEMYNAFQDKTVSLACFQDENFILPLFPELESFINLPTDVKNQLTEFYGSLSIDIDTLKK